jgi:hypothetical protein
MLAIHDDHCRSAQDVRECARHSHAWRREIWGQPTPAERPAPRYEMWAAPARPASEPAVKPAAPPPPCYGPPRKLPFGRIRTADIIDAACALWEIDRDVLLGPSRVANVVGPRMAAMAVARRLTGESYPQLGRRFGGRDHSTVLSAVKKAGQHEGLQAAVAALMAMLPTTDVPPAEEEHADG